ncbi:MAG: hypothetical protein JXB07_04885 [Anaerolineae bacterium]|nr:hypothetical protein [Anaerolineae bacterium]
MKQLEHTQKSVRIERLTRKPAHMGHPVGWNGRVYSADEAIKGYEHATQTPLLGEAGEEEYHEWHYAHLATEEGDLIVIGFVTKQLFLASLGPSPISPGILVDCVMHDGTNIDTLKYYKHYRASRENLDIEIGDSWMKAEDDSANRIHLYVKSGEVELDVDTDRIIPAFRSKTGKTIFGNGTKWEAWDIVQPAATMEGYISIKGKRRHIKGKAYVDHAYGNELFGVHHWYWITVDIGPYTFVASANYTANKHMLRKERDAVVTFMIAKDGRIIGKDPDKVQFTPGPKVYVPKMRRHVAKELEYRYMDHSRNYVLALKQKDILRVKPLLAIVVRNQLVGAIAKKFVIGGSYLRTTYDAWLEVWENGHLVDKYGPSNCNGQVVGEIFYPGTNEPEDYSRFERCHRDMITLFQDRQTKEHPPY